MLREKQTGLLLYETVSSTQKIQGNYRVLNAPNIIHFTCLIFLITEINIRRM